MSLVLLAVTVAVVACSKPAVAPEPVRAVRTLTVVSQSAATSYDFAGEVRARTESRLGFRVAGKIVRRMVDLGDTVKPGQALAQLDSRDLHLGEEGARAALVAAQANLDQNEADLKRFRELREQGFISSADLERRETGLRAAWAQAEQARAQALVQTNQAAYALLVADAGGVVTGVDAEAGMVVAAGASVLRLAHDGPRDVVFDVPEDKVALIKTLSTKPGHFKMRLWGEPTQAWPATIREIAASADPATRTFLVKADIGRAPVRLGQTATVTVELPPTSGVTKLPLSALKEERGRTIVWVLDREASTVRAREIQVSGADGNEMVIGGGLEPGDEVVTAGVHVLHAGQKVKRYVEPGAAAPVAAGVPKVETGR